MSIFSNKSKTTGTTTQNQSGTTTATSSVPDWIKNPTMQLAGNVSGLLNQGPDAFTPQVSDLQQQGFDAAGKLGPSAYLGQSGEALGGVGDIAADQVSGASLLDGGLDKYYNPFKDQVLNPVMQDYDFQSGQTRAGQAADAARNRSFQGSRYGIQEGQTEGALARGRAATQGGLLSDMYGQATGMAESDAGRRQQASLANQSANLQASSANQNMGLERARQLAGLAGLEGSENRANVGMQAGLGGIQTDAENAIRQYPIAFNSGMEGLLTGLNPELYSDKVINSTGTTTGTSNQTTKNSPSLLSSLGQGAQIAAMFSDRRLKRDVETLGYDGRGQRWVTFSYIWEPLRRLVGVIAQEVMRTNPAAVSVHPSGYLQVDYGRL